MLSLTESLSFRIPILITVGAFLHLSLMGCATAPQVGRGMSATKLFSYACAPGRNRSVARGTVWLKVNSKEVSGQFLANVSVEKSELLKLEVVNFLGGTEALILAGNGRFEVIGSDSSNVQHRSADGYWAGVPLRWAPQLFLGRIPCPSADDKLIMSVDSKGELEVLSPETAHQKAEKFVFRFREVNGTPWPYQLIWEKFNKNEVPQKYSNISTVEFSFDDPEDNSLSPTRWEARSDLGGVKVRWRKRTSK